MVEKEIWKPVVGFEGVYEVSNTGKVKSIKRYGTKGGLLNQYVDKDGYMKVVLHKDNIPHYFTVHRLVAIAFIKNPKNKTTVDHIDCNRKNNSVENLRWVTAKENALYSHSLGRQKWNARPIIATSPTGEKFIFASQHEAERQTGVSQSNIGRCANGKTNTVKGWSFEYGSYESVV